MEKFDELVRKLREGTSKDKMEAAAELGQLKDRRAVPFLRKAIKDTDVVVRDNAAFALGQIGATEALFDLVALLDDESKIVRKSSAKALGMLKVKEAVQPLIAKVDEESYLVRKSVIRSLVQLGGERVRMVLAEHLKKEENAFLKEMITGFLNKKN